MDNKETIKNENANEEAQKPNTSEKNITSNRTILKGLMNNSKGHIESGDMPGKQVNYEKKMLFHSRIRTWCTAFITLIFFTIGILIVSIGSNTTRILREAEFAFYKLNTVAADFEEVDFHIVFEEINKLVSDGQALTINASNSMEKALGKVESLDIETLNQSIEDFSAVVKTLSRFFGQ